MGGRSALQKGKSGEREVIAYLQPIVDDVYALHELEVPKLQRNLMQSASGGFDIAGLEWIALEVKRHETPNVEAFWAQTLKQATRGREPVLWYRVNGGKWRIVMHVQMVAGGVARTVRATVDIADFLAWFRARLVAELGGGK